jgi:undecaprenyl-diphosphatase
VVGTAVLLVVRKRYAEALVLVIGLALIYVTVQVTKDALARQRPGAAYVRTSGYAYPSGHAAYATAWIAVAVALTRRLRLVASGVLVFIALAIAAAVGASRGYLRAHWASDVTGGWGLGVGIFATLATVALVVEYIRHNGDEHAGESSESAAAQGTR